MDLEILEDTTAVAKRAVELIIAAANRAVSARGCFNIALSGGHSPWTMLELLRNESMPWHAVHVYQVDERIAPARHADLNSQRIHDSLAGAGLSERQFHFMPVDAPDLAEAANVYAGILRELIGTPPVFDLVQLGLGSDGHTASLVPGDPVLEIADRDVALAGPYQGRLRMTLCYPVLDRARQLLWIVTGSEKKAALRQLLAGDTMIPAGRIRRDTATLVADRAAAG